MAGRRGIYMISCTGDVNLGHRNVTYTDGVDDEYSPLDTCDETLGDDRGAGYRGCQNRTTSGLPCQKWSLQSPQEHSQNLGANGLGDHNLCRNPDGEPSIWC